MKTYVKAAKFFYASETKSAGYLEIINGKFGRYTKEVDESAAKIIDYSNKWIAPGLVDTHIHGYGGVDVMDNDWEAVIGTMSEGLLSCGVTSFLPTTLTAEHRLLAEVAKGIGDHYKEAKGAKIQGIYFEGPYFTKEHKGAQNPIYMGNPSIEEFRGWQEAASGLIKKIALAPERQNVEEFVRTLSEEGVVVALGHSNATLEEATKAVDAGASVWVHAYNGMRGLTHREPGMVGSVMTLKNTYAELICDGHHVHPSACGILMEKLGHEHIAMITDCMRAGGMPEGNYMLGEFPVTVANGTARLSENMASLAGSILRLKEGVKNVVEWNLATVEQAIMMASLIPAISCKIDDKCGQIKEARDADFIVLDENLELVATFLDGVKCYES